MVNGRNATWSARFNMKLRDLFLIVRRDLDDLEEPYLWSDDQLLEFANDAEEEACRRARLIVDSATDDICVLAVTALTPDVDLDPRVIFIRRAKMLTGIRTLRRASYRDLDERLPGWETQEGTVSHFITDLATGSIRLFRIPEASDTLNLTVVRMPLAPMTGLDASPEIPTRYHRSLRHWIKYRAYSVQDAELKNPQKAMEGMALFTAEFGAPSPAVDEMWIEREQASDPFDGTF
jgi:hypothetical protein